MAQAQTQFYVTQLEQRQSFRPFAFMNNGQDTYFWDAGRANKRLVMGFFSPDDLENLLYLRQNQTPLTAASVNTKITNRSYQLDAVQRVVEAFEQGKRKALQEIVRLDLHSARPACTVLEQRAGFGRSFCA